MSTSAIPPAHDAAGARSRTATLATVGAAVLLAAAAPPQLAASFRRWTQCPRFGDDGGASMCGLLEDHVFDYQSPSEPWTVIEGAAQLFGAGLVLVAVAVLVVTLGVARPRGALLWTSATVTAATFAFGGIHALVSGQLGTPSALSAWTAPVALLGQLAWIAWWGTTYVRAPLRALALLPTGLFTAGGDVVVYAVAPLFVGYSSYDTTPWSESIPAYGAGLSALALLVTLVLRSGTTSAG
ncbi:hypothetical protein QWJ90_12475 [Microbacterium oryzae]|uniref:hypothetical protein n=1 Tax=Microbacterium oryzae TaxID=743009 RepID=UPI0025AFA86A|nr:hypothetical protein [Microbacterium oryzae]MDN3311745.1 hypothetical protein [Microbacterium oryzae]